MTSIIHWLNNTPLCSCWNCVEIMLKNSLFSYNFWPNCNEFLLNLCWDFYWFFWIFFIIIYIYHWDDDLLLLSSCWSTVIIKLHNSIGWSTHNCSNWFTIILYDAWIVSFYSLLFKEYKNFNYKEFKFSQDIIKDSIHFKMSDL